jgi:hypothetical protein
MGLIVAKIKEDSKKSKLPQKHNGLIYLGGGFILVLIFGVSGFVTGNLQLHTAQILCGQKPIVI